jgi:DUF1680 family protein
MLFGTGLSVLVLLSQLSSLYIGWCCLCSLRSISQQCTSLYQKLYDHLSFSIYSNSCVDLQILMKFVIRILTKLYEIEMS